MSEEENAQAQKAPPKMQILGQYIRDLSFENILVRKPAEGEVKPNVQVQVALDAKKRSQDNQFEVITKFNVSSKNQATGDTLYVLELEYGGVFQVENIPEEQLHAFLLIECPRMLFPYIRRIVSDVSRDGGFPPLNLDNIDFVQLYRQTMLQRQAGAKGESSSAKVN